jgi:hypothetical protein
MIHRLTRESARAAGACYADDQIAGLIPHEGLSPLQVAALAIPPQDRFWALTRACGDTPRQLREQACRTARRLLALEVETGRAPDPRSVAAVDVAERYARGEATEQERVRAASSAYSAAYAADSASDAAAASAAYAADSVASAACAASAAYAAAYASASAAACAASAAYAAERERQVAEFAAVLEAANAAESDPST